MTLERLRPVADAMLDPVVRLSTRVGIGPHALSLLGFAFALVAGVAFVLGPDEPYWYLAAALFVALSGVFDLLDGAVARELGVSSAAGDVLDHTLDRYADIVLVGALAVGSQELLIGFLAVTGVLMTSYLGTQAQAVEYGRLYAGALGRSDRLALVGMVAVAMFVTDLTVYGLTAVGWLLVLFAVVGHLTAIQRFSILWRELT